MNNLRYYINLTEEAGLNVPSKSQPYNDSEQLARVGQLFSQMFPDQNFDQQEVKFGVVNSVPVEIAGQAVPEQLFIDRERELLALAQPKENTVEQLQKALLQAGFTLPRYGADGRRGPETEAAIRAAELALGRQPTGSITVGELARLKNRTLINTELSRALTAIEAILARYNIKTESELKDIDTLVLEHINYFTASEQIEIWRTLTEAGPDPMTIPAQQRRGTDQFARPEWAGLPTKSMVKPATSPGSVIPPTKFGPQFAKTAATTAAKAATGSRAYKLGRFAGILASRLGAAGLRGLLMKSIPYVGWGLLLLDVGSALYQAFKTEEFPGLQPADLTTIETSLAVLNKYQQDSAMMSALPEEEQKRIVKAIAGLDELRVTLQQQPAGQ